MEAIGINEGLTSWILFWITYWSVGGLLTFKCYIDQKREILHFSEVLSNLCVNMIWTLLGVIILIFLPLRALTDSHILIKLILNYLITEIYFYHVHIMIHQHQLYQKLHKKHHYLFSQPYALSALYSTGYEAVVLNTFAGGLGCIILQIPPPFLYCWFILVSINAVCSHSGYTFGFLMDASHDYHHSSFMYNYGATKYLDKLYGTYKEPEEIKPNLGNFPIEEIPFELKED